MIEPQRKHVGPMLHKDIAEMDPKKPLQFCAECGTWILLQYGPMVFAEADGKIYTLHAECEIRE